MQYEEAEQALKQALTMGAEQAELYFHLSYAQLKQENYKEGIQNLQKAIARNPGMKEAYYNLALIYSEQEEYEYAIEVLERAFERGIRDQSLEELHKEILKKIER
jgi:rhomboid protease GluP